VFRAKEEDLARSWAELYARSLSDWAEKYDTAKGAGLFRVSEAAEAPLAKAEGWFRYQIVVRAPSARDIVSAVRWIESARPVPKDVRLAFDVDAQNLS
jgi:primosomal protein N'